MNHLYFGDCLEVLKELSNYNQPFIDLIYIDPPFNSKRNYNVLFESIDMKNANAQKQAFADTWSNVMYIVELKNLADLNKDLYDLLSFFDNSKCVSDSAVAYLTTMAIRIWHMHKLLKDTGSFYLHCDPTMSHYLKLICDMVFGEKNFQNEIIWQRTTNTGSSKSLANKFSSDTDTILYYTKSTKFTFNKLYRDYGEDYLARFKYEDEKGRYRWQGMKTYSQEKLGLLEKKNELRWNGKGNPEYKQYMDTLKGVPMNNLWTDIFHLNPMSSEKLGYPTQKPVAILERIIRASSNDGDVVADFFCGCGTTIAAAQKLNRKWLGADISHLAIKLILQRLTKAYGPIAREGVSLHGFPKDVDSAKMLARETENGRFGFQEWVIEVLLHGVVNPKKTGDGGYDGYITYMIDKGKEFVLIETKSGVVNVRNIREFIQVVTRQKAAAGIFVCFEETVTKEMLKEAKAAGTITLVNTKTNIDKIQILTVDDMLNEGKQPHLPNVSSTFKQAERVIQKNQLAISF